MANKNRWGSVSGLAVMGAIAMLTGAAVRRLLRHQQQTPLDETPDLALEREALENTPKPQPDPWPVPEAGQPEDASPRPSGE